MFQYPKTNKMQKKPKIVKKKKAPPINLGHPHRRGSSLEFDIFCLSPLYKNKFSFPKNLLIANRLFIGGEIPYPDPLSMS